MRRAACTGLLLAMAFAAPLAHADEAQCRIALGRGWPPATENYGTAVEKLLSGDQPVAWGFTLLPRTGAESGVQLIPDPAGGDWTLRHAVADERVHAWSGGKLELRTQQTPDVEQAAIPAAVATRLIEDWRHALGAVAVEGSQAPFSEEDTWLFVVGDPASGDVLRVSGLRPDCELGELMREQIDLLIEASDEGDEKRAKRWRQLGEQLDRMRQMVDGPAATVDESDAEAEKRRGWTLFK
ncbi:hypothetical protein [Lysobacter solisilvae (ex Woo and Kim 2020)]|uniref:Uncharacterized protein n=1 Tax=Agrilutibacter terrestris TaxID=2865112 RepID=A0A7H0G036_9GAMM|nr:hypothetical protein [Lysobacter terrestris]QNP41652.1 hypothetical protein H8B22_05445 [Lysobacter terrestris]